MYGSSAEIPCRELHRPSIALLVCCSDGGRCNAERSSDAADAALMLPKGSAEAERNGEEERVLLALRANGSGRGIGVSFEPEYPRWYRSVGC